MKTCFISEAIKPEETSFDTGTMAIGEPGVPKRFVWRKTTYEIADVLRKWKTLGECTHGSGEMYLRKHWFHVRTADGQEMTLYFQRKKPLHTKTRSRWYLYSIGADI